MLERRLGSRSSSGRGRRVRPWNVQFRAGEVAAVLTGIGFRVRRRLRNGADALPFLGAVLGLVLAELSSRLDEQIELPETWQYSAPTATGLLSVLVGAMVGLIGFVVTVTVLVIQQATGTLSPRYMRLWYRDPFQKIVLATFAGTLTFSFSLLRRVTDNAVPDIGVTAAGVLVTISVLLLLWYVARFAQALGPSRSLRRLPLRDVASSIGCPAPTQPRPVPAGVTKSDHAGRAVDGHPQRPCGRYPGHRRAWPARPGPRRRMHGRSAAFRRGFRAYRGRPGPGPRPCVQAPSSAGCGACSLWAVNAPSSRTRRSPCASWSTSPSGHSHRRSTTRPPRSRYSTTSRTSCCTSLGGGLTVTASSAMRRAAAWS